ncbi:MAG: type II toxin-antitoxin system prevent-host-death family antitoxin [Caldilineaceae bacterium]
MTVKTYTSEDARLKLRNILDDVMTGAAESVIERYGKPTAVVVNYAQWQAWKRQRASRLAHIRQEMEAGEYITQDELDAGLQERGLV